MFGKKNGSEELRQLREALEQFSKANLGVVRPEPVAVKEEAINPVVMKDQQVEEVVFSDKDVLVAIFNVLQESNGYLAFLKGYFERRDGVKK